jgi:hypothetical protein
MDIRREIKSILKEVFSEYVDYHGEEVAYAPGEYYDEDSPEQYYTPTISDNVKNYSSSYAGYNVVWYGDPDQMIVVHKDNIEGMWGNIYYPEKMEYIVKMLTDYPEKVEIECSYGMGAVTNIIDIQEEQNAVAEDRFESDYDGKERAASTGSEQLDYYVGHEIDDMNFADDIGSEAREFFMNHKLDLVNGKNSPEILKKSYMMIGPDENEIEAFSEYIQFETALKLAQDNKEGDFNRFTVQLRDGHHRVMGAIKAGEEYVCLNLEKDDIIRFKGYYNKV